MRALPGVSVVVPTYNRAAVLRDCLVSLRALEYATFEIVVVDDGSVDGTGQVCAEFDGVTWLHQKHAGRSVARNLGIAHAQYEIVAFTDDDCVVSTDWLTRLMGGFSSREIVGVTGRLVYCAEGYVPEPGERVVENPDARWPLTANCAYRKSALEQVGGFDPAFTRYEDKDLALKVWRFGKIARAVDAVVTHQKNTEVWPSDTYIASSAYWVMLKKRHDDLSIDQNNSAPIWFGFVVLPKKYGALIKRVLLLPFFVLRLALDSGDRKARYELQWLRFLILERIAIWRMALSENVFMV